MDRYLVSNVETSSPTYSRLELHRLVRNRDGKNGVDNVRAHGSKSYCIKQKLRTRLRLELQLETKRVFVGHGNRYV